MLKDIVVILFSLAIIGIIGCDEYCHKPIHNYHPRLAGRDGRLIQQFPNY